MSSHTDTIRRYIESGGYGHRQLEDGSRTAVQLPREPALSALDALLAENQRLREFVIAHTLVEKGVTDFDLQNEAVERLRRASEGVKDIIREALAGDAE